MKSTVFSNPFVKALIYLLYAFALTWSNSSAAATSTTDDFDDDTSTATAQKNMNSLGGNAQLQRRAKYLSTTNTTEIVQKREVDRNWRFEFGVNYGIVAGGDSYVNSQTLGGTLDLHINPYWSVGARYYNYTNSLSSEGQSVFNQANENAGLGLPWTRPEVDYPLNSTLGVVNFYPIAGKLNMFDMGVAQFDVYVLAGAGEITLQSGSTSTWTAGGGVGIWLQKHITARFEVRYQTYQDEVSTGARTENTVVSTFGLGFLL
jgi:outer membrane immunogenic protein